jgi:hypothetical protein
MSWKHLVAAAAVLLVWALPAHAQPVKLRFHDGLVSLTTQNAPLRAILAEWARMGGATIVNGERVVGPALTLELNAVPERQALDILLRSVSGYMLGARPAGTAGTAVFDRILILPTSSAPRNPPPGAPGGFNPGRPVVPQPVRPPVIMPEPDLEEDPPQDVAPPDDDAPVVNPLIRPRLQFPGTGPQPIVDPDPADDQVEPDDQPTSIVPANPFGIPAGSTSRPGVVTPVPQQQPQQRTPRADPEP